MQTTVAVYHHIGSCALEGDSLNKLSILKQTFLVKQLFLYFSFFYWYIPGPLLLLESQLLLKVMLQTGTHFDCADFKICSEGSKILLRTVPCFTNLFQDQFCYEKINIFTRQGLVIKSTCLFVCGLWSVVCGLRILANFKPCDWSRQLLDSHWSE